MHPGMYQAFERIGNWGSVRSFQDALRRAGPERFSHLLRELPEANGGATSPDSAPDCLEELEVFEALGEFGRCVTLIDRETGTEIVTRIAAYDGVFMFGGGSGYMFALDERAFLNISHERDGLVFRSQVFRQVEALGRGSVYTDLASGVSLAGAPGITNPASSRVPSLLEGVVTQDHASRYSHIILPLRRMFLASTLTMHSIGWF